MPGAKCLAPDPVSETNGKLIVVSGPSGVGKSTITKKLLARTRATFSVSATTRRPRPGEVDGRDYRFVDRRTFEQMVAAGELLEHAEVHGEYYGTPAGFVRDALAAGRTVVLEIDVQGGVQVHEKMPEATFVLIVPPDDDELRHRLAERATESPDAADRRLARAEEELRIARESGAYEYTVVNDDLERAVREVVDIVSQE